MITTDDDVFLAGTVPVKDDIKRHQLQPSVRTFSDKMMPAAQPTTKTTRVGSWAISFEHLLEDPAGLATFAEFLKLEFSAENIYFWTACERYRNTESQAERQTQAKQIFNKHMARSCCEPVNLDSQTRNISPEALELADKELFAKAQKQIFHLMKFDSYQRFIRSDLYKNCQNSEDKNHPLPYGSENLDALLKTNFLQSASPKLKKSASNAEDRRRKILLPWHRKTRSKSRDRIDGETATDDTKVAGTHNALNTLIMPAGGKMIQSKSAETLRSSLPTSLKSLTSATCSLCRVKFSDEATTIVQIKPHETVGQLVERLLEKRGLRYRIYDVLLKSQNKTIDLQASSQEIAGEEVEIEQCITFKLYLPDPKVISVKSKPKKQLHEIVSSILQKYNYDMATVDVLRRDTMESMDLNQSVTNVDGQRLHVVLKTTNFSTTSKSRNGAADYQNDNISLNYLKSKELANEFIARNAKNNCISSSESNLNVLSSREKMSSNQLMDLGELKSNESGSETSLFYDTLNGKKAGSFNLKSRGKIPILTRQHSSETQSSTSELNKPIIAKLKAGAKLQVTERVAEKQDELLISLKSRFDNPPMTSSTQVTSNLLLPLEHLRNNKENQNETALQLRQIRSNLSPVNKTSQHELPQTPPPPLPVEKPPSHLLRKKSLTLKRSSLSSTTEDNEADVCSNHSDANETSSAACKGPPPLPPKPKVLPTKPSNWGANNSD
ncbi:regulator of G-protein signaling loco-like isoform X2 [Musca autumnalis]